MRDFKNLTLSDFYEMDIGKRGDGSITPIVNYNEYNKPIGLAGFNGNEGDTDIEIKEAAFLYYKELINRLNQIAGF